MNDTMTTPTTVQLPRRRRSFAHLRDAELRELVRPVLGDRADDAQVQRPDQGVNNRTYLVLPRRGPGVAVKMRPYSSHPVRNSALWPRYTQQLYGPVPNGNISTLTAVSAELSRHGSIRPPDILLVDVSGAHVAAPYMISELLPGSPLSWEAERPGTTAGQLGDHVGRLHAATSGSGFGIYGQRDDCELTDWWTRFARSYRTLAGELARCSEPVAEAVPRLERALTRGVDAGPPTASALVCLDQSPTHYLGPGDGTITAMVDVEGYLFAPPEYEVALLELWIPDRAALARAYECHRPHPAQLLEEVRPAYWLFTWMEWAYCLRTLIHDQPAALKLEWRLAQLARQLV
jgi:hypothetical protein